MEEGTSSHGTFCSRKREGNVSSSQPPGVSSHFSVALLNSGLAFRKTKVLRALQTEISDTPPKLANEYTLPSHIGEGDYSVRHYYKNRFLVRVHRHSFSRKKLCVVALPTDQPCSKRGCGKASHDQSFPMLSLLCMPAHPQHSRLSRWLYKVSQCPA